MRRSIVALVCVALSWLGVTPAANASNASRGGVIAYSVKTGIYSIHADGSDTRLLVPWQPSSCGHDCVIWRVPRNPRYSPDGRHLAYDMETYVVRNGVGDGAQANTREVYVADADGQHRRALGPGHHPEFSPDGKEVIYLANPDAYAPLPLLEEPPKYGDDYGPIEAANISSGVRRALTVPGASEMSSDGKRMLSYRQVRGPNGIAWAQTLENVDGSELHNYFLPTFYGEPPRFTAAGELSYDCPSVGDKQPDICLFDPMTERSHRLLHRRDFWALEAASSPDGRRFAIVGLQGMYVTDAEGRHAHRIIRNGAGPNYVQSDVPTSPVWQPSP
jgi:Tol biopolymer transport system component